jgi:hypothetical protein
MFASLVPENVPPLPAGGRTLMLASLVPENVPPLPAGGRATYMRRLWRHPEHAGAVCEVQLILGKTLERSLGRDSAIALMDSVRVGAIISLRGRPQVNPAAAATAAANGAAPPHVLDVVVSELLVLHRSREHLARALRTARRRGVDAGSAAQLLDMGKDVDSADASSGSTSDDATCDGLLPPLPASAAAVGGQPKANMSPDVQADVLQPMLQEQQRLVQQQQQPQQQQQQQQQPQQQPYWCSPLTPERVHLVRDAPGVEFMRQALLQQPLHSSAAAVGGANGNENALPQFVGLDAEWRPFERGAPATPVSLLQLASRSDAFLVDMLALGGRKQAADVGDCDADADAGGDDGGDAAAMAALDSCLQELMACEHVLLVGHGLAGDLARLAVRGRHTAMKY